MNSQEALEAINKKVADFQQSDEYLKYLKFCSGFRNYSWNNRILIWMQNENASMCAGMKTWNEKGRKIKKGEKALKIYVPLIGKAYTTNEAGEKVEKLNSNGDPAKRIYGFKMANVFDISQTEGEELPTLKIKNLEGKVENFDDYIKLATKTLPEGYSFLIDDEEGHGEKGYTNFRLQQVVVHRNEEQQMFKTTMHELGHVLCEHDKRILDRDQEECEAESVAYIVCNHFGIDSSEYSMRYIGGWKGNKELVNDSLKTIVNVADKIIDAIEGNEKGA